MDPIVSFEVTPVNFSEEDADTNNLVEWKWTVTGEFPAEGITVNLDTSGGGAAFAFTDQFAANPSPEFINADIVDFDDTGRINILLTEPEASFKLYFGNDIIEEGAQPFEFFLVDGDGYTVDPDNNGTIFTITDDNGGPGVGPTIGLTVSETNLAEGDAFTVNFNVEGTIPPEGVQVLVQSDMFGALGQFDLANLSNLTLSGIAGLPEVGDSGGGSFLVTITEPQASIGLSVFDDIIAEADKTINFTLANGEVYEVDPNAGSVTLNISDGPTTTEIKPTVSISVDKTDLIEGETITLSFAIDGPNPIPSEGLTVLVNDVNSAQNQLRSLTEFDVSALELSSGISFPEPADGDSGFFVTITERTASITLPVIDDNADEIEADEVFTFAVIDGEEYFVNPDASSVTINIADPPLPLISVSSTPGTLYESEQTVMTVSLSASRRAPFPEEGGVVVFVDSDVPSALGEFDIQSVIVSGGEIIGSDDDGSGFFFRMDERNATVEVPVFVDDVEEGAETFSFTLAPDEAYEAREGRDSFTVTIEDTVEPPVVTMTGSPTLLRESDGTSLELNFTATGTIPESGTTVVLELYDPALSGIQLSRPSSSGDNVGITVPRGSRQTITDEEGNFVKLLQRVTITEANATLRLPVIDDIFLEEDAEYTINLVDGEGYNIDAAATNSATFTISDGDLPTEVPTIGVTATPSNLYESEQTVVTLSFNAEGNIPAEGVEVFLDSDVRAALGEFDINGSARTGEVEGEGLVVSGGEIIGTDNDGSGFFFRINEANATIQVPVFQDDEVEGAETFTFALSEGEAYNVDANASAASVTIDDVLFIAPEVSLSITPDVVSEEGPNNAFTATFTVDGEIPPAEFDENGAVISGGLQVLLDVKEIGALGEQFDDFSVDGLAFGSYSDPERPTVVSFVLLENTSSITLSMFNDIIEEQPFDFNFELLEDTGNVLGAEYTVDSTANMGSFTLIDGVEYGDTTVGISVSETELTEGDELTLNFDVDGDIPAEGLQVVVQSPTTGALGEFAIFDENGNFNIESQGIARNPEAYDGQGSSFLVTLTEPDASLTLSVFDDGPGEGTESLTFNLADGEAYEVDPDAASVSLNISDVPVVSFSVNTTTLSEENATLFTFSFSVDGVIPEGGLEVALGGDLLPFIEQLDFSNFDFSNPDSVNGLTIGAFREDGAVSLTLLEQSGFVSVRVFDDVVKEADANFDLMLLDGDGYSVNQDANGATITVTDGVMIDNPPVVSLSVSDTSLTEGEEFTVNFSVDGDVSEDNPLTVLVQSTEVGALGEFSLFNEDNTPAFTTEGIMGVPTVGDDSGSSFLVTLTDTSASITLPVFNDGIGEGTESLNFALVDGERYNADAANNQVALTIEETPVEVKFEANANGEVSKFAYDLTGAGAMSVTATVDQEALDITDAAFDNLVGFYEVVDENGGIDTDGDTVADINPGDAGYAQAALQNAVDGMALRLGGNPNDDTSAGSFGDVVLQGGTSYAPFAIANAGDMTVADFLAANPDNMAATEVDSQVAYFAFGEANPDGANHLKSWGDGIFGFEDLPSNLAGVSDNDFNDAVFKFDFTA